MLFRSLEQQQMVSDMGGQFDQMQMNPMMPPGMPPAMPPSMPGNMPGMNNLPQQALQQMQIQAKMLQERIEARKAQLISDAMEEFLKEEQQISSQFGNDPIAMLRSRELDLRAQENARKDQESKDRINLDKMRAMMNQSTQDEKLQQNEDLAKLRADTSIEKTILAAKLKKDSEKSKNKV